MEQYIARDGESPATGNLDKLPQTKLPAKGGTRLEGGVRCTGLGKVSGPHKPLISVIIVVLNRAEVLGNAIKSVIDQSYRNVELIVVDGASVDGSLDVIRKYEQGIDLWVSEPDQGIYHAMNKGIDLATGDWLFFLGSDDRLCDCLETVAQRLADYATVYYGDVYLPTSHRLFAGRFTPYRLMSINIPHQAAFYPRRLFETYRYNTEYFISADYELNLRCFNDPGFTYRYMAVLVSIYEDSAGLSTLRLDTRFDADFRRILKENFSAGSYYKYLLRNALKRFDKYFLRRIGKVFKRKRGTKS